MVQEICLWSRGIGGIKASTSTESEAQKAKQDVVVDKQEQTTDSSTSEETLPQEDYTTTLFDGLTTGEE